MHLHELKHEVVLAFKIVFPTVELYPNLIGYSFANAATMRLRDGNERGIGLANER